MTTLRLRIVVVDDDALVRTALRMILGSQPGLEVVGEAADGLAGVDVALRERPDVVVMDIRMPRLNGIEATRRLTSGHTPCKVLALTTFGDEEYVYEVLRAGASGFLLKNTPTEQLAAAVRVVAAGDCLLAPAVTRMVIERYVATARSADPASGPAPLGLHQLTPRERDVMKHMARGLSNQEIAALLVLGEATVKTHVARILMKLAVRDRAQVVVAAYESGLVVPGEPV